MKSRITSNLFLPEPVQVGRHIRPFGCVFDREPRDDEQVHVGEDAGEFGLHVGDAAVLERAFVLEGFLQLVLGGLPLFLRVGVDLLGALDLPGERL